MQNATFFLFLCVGFFVWVFFPPFHHFYFKNTIFLLLKQQRTWQSDHRHSGCDVVLGSLGILSQNLRLWLRPVFDGITKSCKHPTCKSTLLPPTLAVKPPRAELLLDCPHLKCLYLRTTCSDTLMLRDRKASTAEGSFSSFTGGELFKPCFAFLASLKLLCGEAPSPKRGHRREETIVGM